MATANLPISRLINIGIVITPEAVQAPSLSTGLVLGTSDVIDTKTRMRDYSDLTEVADDFGTDVEEYFAAELWFGQSPQPTSMFVGRWCKTAAAGELICGPLPADDQLLAPWNAINAGSFKVGVDGGAATNVPALDFSASVTLNNVALVIQTAMQGLGGSYANATVVYNAEFERFEFTSGTTGSASSVSFLTAGTTGTDISAMLQGQADDGGYTAPGVVAESALSCVVLFDTNFGGQWYNFTMPDASDADHVAIAPYIDGDANPHFYWITTQEPQVLVTGDTTHIGALLQALQSQHTAWQYSSTNAYAAWSMASRIATVDYAGEGTCISLMYKTEPGVAPESLNTDQIDALEGYNGNVYVSYQFGNSTAIIEKGICPSGQFIDTIIGVDGLKLQAQQNVFNLLLSAPKIPQTDDGVNTLENGVQSACEQFVTNGFLAAGVWNGISFGQLVSGQWLQAGYYIYAQPIANQSQAQRQARICPPIQVAVKCAGAIDTVSATIYVND